MNLEGKTCGVCNKGKMHKFTEKVSEGVYVEAYKCDYGHISYTKEVQGKIEALERDASEERHVVRVGSSLAVPIPSAIVKHLRLKPKEKVFVRTQDNQIVIRPSPT